MMRNKIGIDFQNLVSLTKRAFLSADLNLVDRLGIYGHFPYFGPGYSLTRNAKLYQSNPLKGYRHGLFLMDYSRQAEAEHTPAPLIPLKSMEDFEATGTNQLNISCGRCEDSLDISLHWLTKCYWGDIDLITGTRGPINGELIFELVEQPCEDGHFSWGLTSMLIGAW